MGSKGGNTLENGVHFNHMNVSSVSVICFIGKCLMRSSQDEKKIKKERRKSVPGVVGVDDPYPLPQ